MTPKMRTAMLPPLGGRLQRALQPNAQSNGFHFQSPASQLCLPQALSDSQRGGIKNPQIAPPLFSQLVLCQAGGTRANFLLPERKWGKVSSVPCRNHHTPLCPHLPAPLCPALLSQSIPVPPSAGCCSKSLPVGEGGNADPLLLAQPAADQGPAGGKAKHSGNFSVSKPKAVLFCSGCGVFCHVRAELASTNGGSAQSLEQKQRSKSLGKA